MSQSKFRANMVKQAQSVIDGNVAGNKDNAITAILLADAADWTDALMGTCLLYTSPSPRDRTRSRMPSSA